MADVQPTVFIVDDDELIRHYCDVIIQHAGLPTEQHSSAREFLRRYELARPGCLVLDIRMPDMSGLELQEELNRRGAIIPVIFATGVAEVPVAVGAMLHGAFDYLQKPLRAENLLDRVRRALAFDTSTRASLLERKRTLERFAMLTEREREILSLVIAGLSNKEAALRMRLSARTVEIHRAGLMRKTGARNAAHLVRMAMEFQDRQGRAPS
jgi:two-component system, LuxR family, response regulator FixJ